MKKAFIAILAGAFILYLLALAALYTFQRSVLYIPPKVYLTPAGVELSGAAEVSVPNEPSKLLGWWMPPKEPHAPVVMYFHGNASAVYGANDIYRTLHQNGYGVFALAYPGYPGRPGDTSQKSLTHAAVEGYDFVLSQGVQAENIVLYGTSLGAGIAAQLSTERKAALIVMEAPFTSAADMAQLTFPIFPAALLTKDKFHSDRALAAAQIPMIWIHGTQDSVIPLSVGQALYDGYNGPKSGHIISNGQHTNLWYRGGDALILNAISDLSNSP